MREEKVASWGSGPKWVPWVQVGELEAQVHSAQLQRQQAEDLRNVVQHELVRFLNYRVAQRISGCQRVFAKYVNTRCSVKAPQNIHRNAPGIIVSTGPVVGARGHGIIPQTVLAYMLDT